MITECIGRCQRGNRRVDEEIIFFLESVQTEANSYEDQYLDADCLGNASPGATNCTHSDKLSTHAEPHINGTRSSRNGSHYHFHRYVVEKKDDVSPSLLIKPSFTPQPFIKANSF